MCVHIDVSLSLSLYIYIYIYIDRYMPSPPGKHDDLRLPLPDIMGTTQTHPTPHHAPFNKFKCGFIKCKDLLNTHRTELVHCIIDLFNWFKSDFLGWGGFVWSPYYFLYSTQCKGREGTGSLRFVAVPDSFRKFIGSVRFGSVRQTYFPVRRGSACVFRTRRGSVRLGSVRFLRPVPAGSRIQRFGSLRFGRYGSISNST